MQTETREPTTGSVPVARRWWIALTVCLAAADLPADDLDWLLGCWESPDRTGNEVWVRGTDGTMLGFAVTLSGGEIGFYEILHIYREESGTLAYAAYPMGRSPTVFREVSSAADRIRFSNPAHDYPQEIAYRREGDSLFGTISKLDGAEPQSFDKTRCK